MKKTISIILIFIFILAIIARVVRVQADTVMVSLNLNKTAVETGDTFTATLFATCADEINGVITSFSYDTDKLELISESVGTDFASLGENNNIELIASKAGITEANVYTLEFKAKETIEEVTTATVSLSDITVSPMTGDDTTLAGISKSITINPATINVSATKQYDDNNNQDGKREDAKFDLYKKVGQGQYTLVENSTKTISKDATGEGLVATWNDIPKYENGIEIEYSVEEELTNVVTGTDAPGTYKVEKTGDYKTGITIKNTHTPETINVSATKQYNDNNNQDGKREDAKFNLYKKVGESQNTLVENSTKTISKDATGEGLVVTWNDLPKYENGVEIEYSVEEELTNVVTGTDAPGTYKVEKTGDYKTGITIRNTHTPETINVRATKEFNDYNNQDGIREDAKFDLYKKIGESQYTLVENSTKTISKDATGEGLVATWNDLPKYENGVEIEYSVEEELTNVVTGTDTPGTYKVEKVGDYKTGITIRNTHTPQIINVSATKQYDDNNNQDGIREDAKFDLYKKVGQGQYTLVANSTKTISKDATGEGLVAIWNNLPKYENGVEIEYSVEEELTNVVTGADATGTYKVEKTGDYKTGITIKNTHTPQTNQGGGNTTPSGGTTDGGNTTPTGGTIDTGNTTPTGGTTDTGNTTPTGGTTDTGNTTPTGGTIDTGNTTPTGGTTDTGNTTPTGGTIDTGNTTPTGGTTDTGNTTPSEGTTDTGNTTPSEGTTDTGNTTPLEGTTDTENTTPTGGTTDTGNTTPSSNASYDETTNTVRNINSDLNKNKSSKSSSKLPYTGTQQIIIWTILVVSGIAGVMYVLNRKYRGI